MLIKYSCKGMGLKCSFVVTGGTQEDVVKKALEHVREMHADVFNSIQSPAEIKDMEQALKRSTKVVTG